MLSDLHGNPYVMVSAKLEGFLSALSSKIITTLFQAEWPIIYFLYSWIFPWFQFTLCSRFKWKNFYFGSVGVWKGACWECWSSSAFWMSNLMLTHILLRMSNSYLMHLGFTLLFNLCKNWESDRLSISLLTFLGCVLSQILEQHF